ncbi:MAG TPA: transglycosylase SLT domain-containing protein, partial [Solirubrobacteraceae bacterium]|nr:transglycosylase SLT domain-containing protein [Solirubrobacteraceae bacterium]
MISQTLPVGSVGGIPTAAAQRVLQIQALIARMDHPSSAAAGSASTFASTLDAAQGATAEGATATGTGPVTAPGIATGAGAGVAANAGADAAAGAASYLPLVDRAAARYGLDPALLYGLIQQESGFDPSARSSAGALGLTQLMPSTAASLGVTEPLDPAQSIEGGARYLSQLLHQFAGNTADALAAYNAGAG